MRFFLFIGLLTMFAITSKALLTKSSRGITGLHFRQTLSLLSSSSSSSALKAADGSVEVPSTDFRLSANRKLNFDARNKLDFDGEVLVVPMYQSRDGAKKPALELNGKQAFNHDVVNELVADGTFTAESGSDCVVRVFNLPMKYVALVGLGPAPKDQDTPKLCPKTAKRIAASVVSIAEKTNAKKLGVVLPSGVDNEHISSMMRTIHDSLYQDERFRLPPSASSTTAGSAGQDTKSTTTPRKPPGGVLAEVSFLAASSDITAHVAALQQETEYVMSGVNFAKDLVGAPSNSKTPVAIAQAAKEMAETYGLEAKILGLEECQRLNMGGYLGVQQGSMFPPQFVHLTYRPKHADAHSDAKITKVALIGKGLTFDSGGYNLKAGAGSMIELMKFDMGGCGAVLGAAKAIAQLQPQNVEVHFISAICENMVSAHAMRPGDILVASNGKTIEVLNTDAEGRLTLADALVYAERLGVDQIIDLATLTGACIMGLGSNVAGLYANNDALRASLEAAASRSGDKLWHMPLEASYKESIQSNLADLKNISGGKGGGSITAALFLQEFLSDSSSSGDKQQQIPWAHIDMAGPVWDYAKSRPTGFGVRLLVDYLLHVKK